MRFRLPDPVLALRRGHRTRGAWMDRPDPERADLMQVPGAGPFVRALLQVGLTGGYQVTFGVWVGVEPDDLQRAFRAWTSDEEYRSLVLHGRLANALPGWGLLGAPVTARVEREDELPYIRETDDAHLAQVLGAEWPHDEVLPRLP